MSTAIDHRRPGGPPPAGSSGGSPAGPGSGVRAADRSRDRLSPVPAPSLRSGRRAAVRSCRVDVAVPASGWRLTDRGIAVVLVLAAMIIVAAVTVIGLTAWRVTRLGLPADGGAGTGCVSSR